MDNYTLNVSEITTDISSDDSNAELPITVTCLGSAFISLFIIIRFLIVFKKGRNVQGSGEINL